MAEGDSEVLIRRPSVGRSRSVQAIYFDDSDTELEELQQFNAGFVIEDQVDSLEDAILYSRHPTPDTPIPITHLPERDIKREGHVSKQGGVNQDKGWQKRYLRFDGQTLRYYLNDKVTTSLRIIPVGIMEQANYEERRNSARPGSGIILMPSRAYRFTLKTTNRTYLFATDSHDNCVQWVMFLTEAILNKNKENVPDGVLIGGPSGKPDIEGSLKFARKSKKYHAALKGDIFRYYYNKEDYEIDCPVHELHMQLTNVKRLDNTKLQLRSAPYQLFVLQFESPEETDQWQMYLQEASANIGDNNIVDHIKQNPDNRMCADCTSKKINWASVNLGVVLCIKCAGIHRGLGVHHSKVRSLRMDNIFRENDQLLQLFTAIGNRNAKAFWYANPEPDRVIDEETPDCIRQKHIEQKYKSRDFIDKALLNSPTLNEDFLDAVQRGDVVNAMKLYESGANLHYKSEDSGLNAIDIAKLESHIVMLEYLEQNKSREDIPNVNAKTEEEALHKQSSIHHDGYLEKTGPNMKGFLKRWFVLHYNRLTYFDDKKGSGNPKEKGCIDLKNVVCVAIMYCKERPFCLDLTCKENKRIYRLAAQVATERRKWINTILQVICPEGILDVPIQIKEYRIAGYFYVQQHAQGPWVKAWFGVGIQYIDIVYFNESLQSEQIHIAPGALSIYKYNASRSTNKMISDMTTTKQLDENMMVELQIEQRLIRVQGHHADDTEKVFNILNPIVNT